MKWIVGMLLVVALGVSAWWWVAVTGLERAVTDWFEERRAEGWQAELAAIETGGFPTEIDAVLLMPALADPQTGVAVQISALRLHAPAYWPGNTTLEFPQDAMQLATPDGTWSVLADMARADMRLKPGTALEIEQLGLTSGPWIVSGAAGDSLRADGLTITAAQQTAATYDVIMTAPGLRPGDATRAALRVPDDWPLTFQHLTLDMTTTFDRPWDLRALEDRRPQPRHIVIRRAQAEWGELQFQAAADLTVDEGGVPTGTLSLQARNWRDMLALAEAAGALPSGVSSQIERGLTALAGLSGNPNAIDVELDFADGRMSFGFLPLGPAPRLILR